MKFSTICYVRPAKAQTSLRVVQTEQSLKYSMTVKLPTENYLEFLSLKGGRTCSSEYTLVKMSHCWISHDAVSRYKLLEKTNNVAVGQLIPGISSVRSESSLFARKIGSLFTD